MTLFRGMINTSIIYRMESLQVEVNQLTENIEDEILAPIQGFGYKKASLCFTPGLNNRKSRQSCVESALHPASQAAEYVQNEFNNLSERVNRCAQTCHDDIVGFSRTQNDSQKTRLEECTNTCMFKAKAALPEMKNRICETLKPIQPPLSEFTKGTILADKSPTSSPASLPDFSNLPPSLTGSPPMAGTGFRIDNTIPSSLPKLG